MNTDHEIIERIKSLSLEQEILQKNHKELVHQNHRINQEFQEQVSKNQTRFAQIQGALIELQQLKKTGEQNEPINVNRSYTATSGSFNRITPEVTQTTNLERNEQ